MTLTGFAKSTLPADAPVASLSTDDDATVVDLAEIAFIEFVGVQLHLPLEQRALRRVVM